ncbi:MAG: nucleotidyltransferase domain-containing protein [Candidatus Stahlbacteria bacterium]|nr:nucleotidyltransferase domain-containing protein [Candidatus Stahlbacteria bacterium]
MAEDKNLIKIKEVIKNIFPDNRIILFGSRGRGNFDRLSDYDILVIVKQNLSIKEKRQFASKITNKLASMLIATDVIIKTEKDVNYYQDKIGSVVREAVREGMYI